MLEEVVAELHGRHRSRWKQDYADHPDRLARDVEELLIAMGLLRRWGNGDLRLAAIANRYAPDVDVVDLPATLDLESEEQR
jgi:hypothetical protein